MLSRNGWGGLAVAAASLLLFGLTLGLKDNPMVPIGPGFYPRIVLGLTAALGITLLVLELLRPRRRVSPGDGKPAASAQPDHLAVVIHFGVFGLYVVALPYVGFRLATVLYVAAANALLAPPRGLKGWARVAALALLTTIAAYVVFERYLLVLLPRGRWTGF